MTETPLGDLLADCIETALNLSLLDVQRVRIADALLREFDISLRSPHPTPEKNFSESSTSKGEQ